MDGRIEIALSGSAADSPTQAPPNKSLEGAGIIRLAEGGRRWAGRSAPSRSAA